MIRTLTNSRRWSSIFVLALCAGVMLHANQVAADPSDLEELGKRVSLRMPSQSAQLKVVIFEPPIVIGPVPGYRSQRTQQQWTAAACARGPVVKKRESQRLAPSFQSVRAAR